MMNLSFGLFINDRSSHPFSNADGTFNDHGQFSRYVDGF